MKIKLKDESQTMLLGQIIGASLKGGELICLLGDLGAGKTCLTRSLAKKLGIDEDITSPTFTIVNEYEGNPGLNHFDVYRIGHSDELYDIGFEEYLENNRVTIIEWADIIEEILPSYRLECKLTYELEGRSCDLSAYGEYYEKLLKDIEIKIKNENLEVSD